MFIIHALPCVLTGWTTLMQSCENERFHMVEWLLQNGADPNVQMTVTGWTAMHAAAKVGHHNILKALLEKGGDKTLRARNQSLGNNLTVEDCTSDENLLKLLEKYPRPQCPPVN